MLAGLIMNSGVDPETIDRVLIFISYYVYVLCTSFYHYDLGGVATPVTSPLGPPLELCCVWVVPTTYTYYILYICNYQTIVS